MVPESDFSLFIAGVEQQLVHHQRFVRSISHIYSTTAYKYIKTHFARIEREYFDVLDVTT